MKKANNKIQEEIVFYSQKLPPLKQVEALDFIKWLWGGVGVSGEYTREELEKLEKLSKGRKGKAFNSEELLKHLDKLSRSKK